MKTEPEGNRAAGACDSHALSASPDRGELPLGHVHNVRDLGGLAFTDGDGRRGTTAAGVFLRAPSLRRLREADFAFLRSYGDGGLARVVDLRSGFEVSHWPDPYAGGRDGVVYTHVPMLDQLNSNGFRDALPYRMLTVYKSLLDNDGASIAQVMTALDSDGAPGVRCSTAGRARTARASSRCCSSVLRAYPMATSWRTTLRPSAISVAGCARSASPCRSPCAAAPRAACSRPYRPRWS